MSDPKQKLGAAKAPLHLIPPVFSREVAHALSTGARKYGAWNWRDPSNRYLASTYVSAMKRHIDAWYDGEDRDKESFLPHLAHVAASVAILMDAEAHGTFKDDRPVGSKPC
ncbi:dATP/dGTP diphosphohydrolase domain-containing protein [Limnobacter sp.]|uniref:dATP/dGTP diphosphohydrolase domain-containing protein n=1 Tax=Limnobacter sp. TaxID=2003368 RepID=UPI00344FFA6A